MDAFEALADPVRRNLLIRLRDGPARVVDLAAEHDISRPAISKHLRGLIDAGLVDALASGRERHYHLVRAGFVLIEEFLDQFSPARPPIPEYAFDGLDLEVRRTVHDRRGKDHSEMTENPDTKERTA